MIKLVDLIIGGLHQAARCVEEDRVDAVVADRDLIPVRPVLLVEVAIGDDRDRRRPDEQPDVVLAHPRPDLGEVVEREHLSEARDALIRAEPRHVRLLPERAFRVLPDRVAVRRLDDDGGLAYSRLDVAHRRAGLDRWAGGAFDQPESDEPRAPETKWRIHRKASPKRDASPA